MPADLKRYQKTGDLHFLTFSCYERRPYLGTPQCRNLFLEILNTVSHRYNSIVDGFVVMPEHVHLLLYEPKDGTLASMMRSLKQSTAQRQPQRPFWYPRYYDFNIFTAAKRLEKLDYMHWNPVKRNLCAAIESWPWSSATSRPARIPTSSPPALEMGHPHRQQKERSIQETSGLDNRASSHHPGCPIADAIRNGSGAVGIRAKREPLSQIIPGRLIPKIR